MAHPPSLQWSASLAPGQARRREAAVTGFRLASEEQEIGEIEGGRTAAAIVVPPSRRRGPWMRLPERAHPWSLRREARGLGHRLAEGFGRRVARDVGHRGPTGRPGRHWCAGGRRHRSWWRLHYPAGLLLRLSARTSGRGDTSRHRRATLLCLPEVPQETVPGAHRQCEAKRPGHDRMAGPRLRGPANAGALSSQGRAERKGQGSL